MAPEEFRIKITKAGEIFVDFRGLSEQRVRDLRTMFEEILGPATEHVTLSDDGPGGAYVRLANDEEKDRSRIKK